MVCIGLKLEATALIAVIEKKLKGRRMESGAKMRTTSFFWLLRLSKACERRETRI